MVSGNEFPGSSGSSGIAPREKQGSFSLICNCVNGDEW